MGFIHTGLSQFLQRIGEVISGFPVIYSLLLILFVSFCSTGSIKAQSTDRIATCITDVTILPTDTVTCRFPRPNLTATGNTAYTYRWVDESNTELGMGMSIPLVTGGNYQLIVNDPVNGCTDTLYTYVHTDQREPIFAFGPIDSFNCLRNEVAVTAIIPGFDDDSLRIEWRTLGATLIGITPTHVITDGLPYVAVMRNTTNGCGSRDTVQIAYDTLTPQPLVNHPPELILDCNVDSLLFFATIDDGIYTHEWTDTSGSLLSNVDSVLVGTSGVLRLTTTRQENGCSSTQDFTIESHELEFGEVLINYPACSATENASVQVESISGGSGYYLLMIDDELIEIGEAVSLVSGTTYTITATDDNNCSSQLIVDIPTYRPLITAVITNQESYVVGDSVFASAEIEYTSSIQINWYENGILVFENCWTYQTIATQNLVLEARLTDEFGCSISSVRSIDVSDAALVYLPSAFSPNLDGINDYLRVFASDHIFSIDEMSCYDRWGNRVFSSTNSEEIMRGWDGAFRGKKSISGNYIVRVVYTTLGGVSGSINRSVSLVR
jgi:gliding motility-associated-like protein